MTRRSAPRRRREGALTDDSACGSKLRPVGHASRRKTQHRRQAVRSKRFADAVRQAYEGRCALCAVRASHSAHIHDFAELLRGHEPGCSCAACERRDHVTNGIALCANHHGWRNAGDLAIDPTTYRVFISDELEDVEEREQIRQTTAGHLRIPTDLTARPMTEALEWKARQSKLRMKPVDEGPVQDGEGLTLGIGLTPQPVAERRSGISESKTSSTIWARTNGWST